MKVYYAVYTYKKSPHPFMVIYDMIPFGGRRSASENNWQKLYTRTATAVEVEEIKNATIYRRFLSMSYKDVDTLVADELLYDIKVPEEIIQQMKNFKFN